MSAGGILQYELRRAFSSRAFHIAFACAACLALLHLISVPMPYALSDTWTSWRSGQSGMPPSVWSSWMGATPYSIWSVLFYYLSPLLCSAPFASTLCSDLKDGLVTELVTRTSRRRYFAAKTLTSCFMASIIIVVPQVLNLVGTMLFLPVIPPDPVTGIFPVSSDAAAANLFYENPWAYMGLFLLVDIFVVSLLSCEALASSLRLRLPFLVLVLPFVTSVLVNFLLFTCGLSCYAPNVIVAPYQEYPGLNLVVAFVLIVILSAAFILFFRNAERELDII